jgi:hypothetical protein
LFFFGFCFVQHYWTRSLCFYFLLFANLILCRELVAIKHCHSFFCN